MNAPYSHHTGHKCIRQLFIATIKTTQLPIAAGQIRQTVQVRCSLSYYSRIVVISGGADSAVPPSPLSLMSRPSPQANTLLDDDDLTENVMFGDDAHDASNNARHRDSGDEADSDGERQEELML